MKRLIRYIIPFVGILTAVLISDPALSNTINLIGGSQWGDAGRFGFSANARWIIIEMSALELINLNVFIRPNAHEIIRYRSMRKMLFFRMRHTCAIMIWWLFFLTLCASPKDSTDWIGLLTYIAHVTMASGATFLLYMFIDNEGCIRTLQICACVFAMIFGWLVSGTALSRICSWGMMSRSQLVFGKGGYMWQIAAPTLFISAAIMFHVASRMCYLLYERR